jgi:hypothetical protein
MEERKRRIYINKFKSFQVLNQNLLEKNQLNNNNMQIKQPTMDKWMRNQVNKELVNINSLMEMCIILYINIVILGNGLTIYLMVKVYIYLIMEKDMKDIYKVVRNMVLEYIIMLMVIHIMENGSMIWNKEKENIFIIYKENLMMVNGNLVKDMVEVFIVIHWVINMMVNGKED